MKKSRCRKAFPPPAHAARLLVRVAPEKVGLFRFLLEAHDHLGVFTVLNRREALLKVLYSPHEERRMQTALAEMGETIPLTVLPWPVAPATQA